MPVAVDAKQLGRLSSELLLIKRTLMIEVVYIIYIGALYYIILMIGEKNRK